MTENITWNCAYAVRTRAGIEYGPTSVNATSEVFAVLKIIKKILNEIDEPFANIVNIIINAEYSTITEQYDEDTIKKVLGNRKVKR